uniref:NADH-ubiquinone oxidoreductase chain 4 n=1 Tax=Gessius rufidorsus TaxID=1971641 RepID=A0A6C0MDS4_9HEMI|nr:NADH dehydrogenase subunit 4 [Gessius sp. 'rufidorsus']
MMIILFFFFLIPLLFLSNYFYQFSLIILMITLFKCNFYSFFCNISYGLGFDTFSFFLLFLTLLISCLMIMSYNCIFDNYFFIFMVLFICLILLLIFMFMNLFMFYLFFEFSLIPLMLMIFGWGKYLERMISSLYLFFYTLISSLPLLILMIYFYFNFDSLFIGSNFLINCNFYIHLFMVISFLVKFPMFMLHFWLPKAHVQAPIFGSMILAGLMLKVGGYGFFRFMTLFDYIFYTYSYVWYSFSLMGCLIVSLICLVQGDIKCLIAYSSISHMSLCLMGFLSLFKIGFLGSYMMMISHGFCSSGLFCLANFIYLHTNSRSFYINKGMISFMPSMSFMWFMFCLFNMSCPPSINFLSEVFIMYSMLKYWFSCFIFFVVISFLSACFSFYLYVYSQCGQFSNFYSFFMISSENYLFIFVHLIMIFVFIIFCPLIFF